MTLAFIQRLSAIAATSVASTCAAPPESAGWNGAQIQRDTQTTPQQQFPRLDSLSVIERAHTLGCVFEDLNPQAMPIALTSDLFNSKVEFEEWKVVARKAIDLGYRGLGTGEEVASSRVNDLRELLESLKSYIKKFPNSGGYPGENRKDAGEIKKANGEMISEVEQSLIKLGLLQADSRFIGRTDYLAIRKLAFKIAETIEPKAYLSLDIRQSLVTIADLEVGVQSDSPQIPQIAYARLIELSPLLRLALWGAAQDPSIVPSFSFFDAEPSEAAARFHRVTEALRVHNVNDESAIKLADKQREFMHAEIKKWTVPNLDR